MTLSSDTPRIKDGRLTVRGKEILTSVPANIVTSPASSGSAFFGAISDHLISRHVFSLGVLKEYRYLSLFRFNIWWLIPRFGKSADDIRMETQLLLLEVKEVLDTAAENMFYVLILPVLDGDFRASLQGSSSNELEFCLESGDPSVRTSQALEAVFINSGQNPFELLSESLKILEKHKGTFNHIDKKKIPENLDWFGWCTWDAFYFKVDPDGIRQGLESLSAGGCPPRFLIVDDGWQKSVKFEKDDFAKRLVDTKENEKFRDIKSNCGHIDFGEFIHSIKKNYGLKHVYLWHGLSGDWGGVLHTSEALRKYNPKLVYPITSPGNNANIRDVAMINLEKCGFGIIDPSKIYEFYNDLHGYLASKGVDGVKVDVQNVMETVGFGYGGRVSMTRQYQWALEESIAKNFIENNLICCMSHNTDCIYSSMKSAVARAASDYLPREENVQTIHVASVAFNSLLLGEIVVPDWDMFHSKHVSAEFHAAARAVGGCGVYVSDQPGTHDFNILRRLVLPDGSTLRARCPGRPTRDCLFDDPVMDGKRLLKIWNMNQFTGVIGVFNCQGAGSWPCREIHPNQPLSESTSLPVTGHVHPVDVEFLDQVAGENWTGDCAVYAFNSKSLSRVHKRGSIELTLGTSQCEVYTISPIREYNQELHFAPVGLIDMYNSGGAIGALHYSSDSSGCKIEIRIRGCSRFGAYASKRPKCCSVDHKEEEFSYSDENGFLIIELPPYAQVESNLQDIDIVY